MMQARSTRFMIFLFALALLAMSAAVLEAQDTTPEATTGATAEATETVITDITYNTAVTGNITDASPSQSWPLQAPSADRIHVLVERLDGNLIPDVQVMDTTGAVVGQSYGADHTGAAARTDDFKLASGGVYQVVVSRKDHETGVTSGQYRLTVFADATAKDNINNTTVIGTLTAGTPVEGEVTATHWYQLYTYTSDATDTIRLNVARTSGNLMPMIYVLDNNNNVLTSGYTANTGDTVSIDTYTLPTAGTYTVAVSRTNDYDGDTVGKYTLTMTLIGVGADSKLLDGTAGTVEYDTPLTGEIGGGIWYQNWTLKTTAADSFTIEVDRADGNLRPYVVLLGGSGQELSRSYPASTGDTSSIDTYTLQNPGTYTVRVGREGDQTGLTTGKYALTVHLVGAGVDSADLKTPVGAVTTGTPATGEITNTAWENTWTYDGTEGDELKIAVKRTSGTLMPILEIRDLNGQQLTSGYTDSSGDTSSIDYRIANSGQYQIVVERSDTQNGQTTGGYELTVEKAAS